MQKVLKFSYITTLPTETSRRHVTLIQVTKKAQYIWRDDLLSNAISSPLTEVIKDTLSDSTFSVLSTVVSTAFDNDDDLLSNAVSSALTELAARLDFLSIKY